MAQENIIRKAGKLKLALDGYVCWTGAKAMYQSSDIFGIFDVIAAKKNAINEIRLIQWTSIKNMGARRRKIRQFFLTNNLFIPSELWGYEYGKWKIEIIQNPLP